MAGAGEVCDQCPDGQTLRPHGDGGEDDEGITDGNAFCDGDVVPDEEAIPPGRFGRNGELGDFPCIRKVTEVGDVHCVLHRVSVRVQPGVS